VKWRGHEAAALKTPPSPSAVDAGACSCRGQFPSMTPYPPPDLIRGLDAATLRPRHVARQMDCSSSWTLRNYYYRRGNISRYSVSPAKSSWRSDKQSSRLVFPFTARCVAAILPSCLSVRGCTSPKACISLDSFGGVWTFQRVTAETNKKILLRSDSPSELCGLSQPPSLSP
jgi:hypothetical protein